MLNFKTPAVNPETDGSSSFIVLRFGFHAWNSGCSIFPSTWSLTGLPQPLTGLGLGFRVSGLFLALTSAARF